MRKLDDWTISLRKSTERFQNSFGGLSPNALNWKANESSWSIAQVIEHLIKINESYFPIFEKINAGSYSVPWIARIPGIPNYFGSLLYKSLAPDRKKKTKTFSIWEPSASSISATILEDFAKHHEKLIALLKSNEELFGKGVVISSPANRFFVYPLDQVMDILLIHEERHYNQALEVLAFQKGTEF